MAIEDLIAVVPPPEQPDEAGSLMDLLAVERRIGIELPTDYREFAIRYGTGWFLEGHLTVANPFVRDVVALTIQFGDCQQDYDSGTVPWPSFPAVPGLLEFGSNENANRLLFLVDGDPDGWPIIVVPHGAGRNQYERWDLTFGTFLARALRNEILTCAVHARLEPVQQPVAPFQRCSDVFDLRDGKWVRKRKRRR